MATQRDDSRPLADEQLARLQGLPPEGGPPESVLLNYGTVRLPEGVRAELVAVDGAADTYRVRVALPGAALGVRVPPARIPTRRLTEREVGKEAPEVLEGFRPPHLPVTFRPTRVALPRRERRQPPVDFVYERDGEPLDRPTNVFAPDGRYIYRDTDFPWSTVGRVDTPLGSCTGCTIGPRLLLTANHCIQWNDDDTAGWVRFRPAYYNGSAPFGEAWATQVIFWTQVSGGAGLSDAETAFDYVVCVLDDRMGDIVGYPGYRAYRDRWNGDDVWQHMGYPSDLSGGERPAFQGPAVISTVGTESTAGQTGFVLGHFNDIVTGHSGGPVWGWWGDEPWPRVVGTQSTEARTQAINTSGDNEFGGGPALSSLITWARANFS